MNRENELIRKYITQLDRKWRLTHTWGSEFYINSNISAEIIFPFDRILYFLELQD